MAEEKNFQIRHILESSYRTVAVDGFVVTTMGREQGQEFLLRPYVEDVVIRGEEFPARMDDKTGSVQQVGGAVYNQEIVRFVPISLRLSVTNYVNLTAALIKNLPLAGNQAVQFIQSELEKIKSEVSSEAESDS